MSKRGILHLKPQRQLPPLLEGADPLAEPLDDAKPAPRKRPARMMPYSIKEHPEHEGAVSLARAAPLATRTDWERMIRENPGKALNALDAVVPDASDLIRALATCAQKNVCVSVSDSQGDFRLMAGVRPKT